MKLAVATLLVFFTIILVACGGRSADLAYMDSGVLPDLEIPPDLTLVSGDSDFELPEIFSGDGTNTGGKVPVLANVDSIRLMGHSDYYWLSIDEPVDNLYQLVKDFWASEGFTLAMDEPVIGIIKTDWVFNAEGTKDEEAGFLAKLFSGDQSSESQDQFKTRIAQDIGTDASQIYISHRGTEYNHVGGANLKENDELSYWGVRASEPELEVEMLSRLMLYLGLRQSDVDRQLGNIKLFAPRASIHVDTTGDKDEEETFILVKDEKTRTWNRTLHQLERLNFEVISAKIEIGLAKRGVLLVETDIEIEDDVSGFFSLLSKVEIVKKRIKLIFSEEAQEITRISMETEKGDIENSPEGVEFLTLLYQYVK